MQKIKTLITSEGEVWYEDWVQDLLPSKVPETTNAISQEDAELIVGVISSYLMPVIWKGVKNNDLRDQVLALLDGAQGLMRSNDVSGDSINDRYEVSRYFPDGNKIKIL